MDNIKQVAITGSAVTDYAGGGRKTRRGRRAASMQMGGENDDPAPGANTTSNAKLNIVKSGGALTPNLEVNSLPQGQGTALPMQRTPPVHAPSPVPPAPQMPAQPSQQGGKPKIILAPKQKTKKVVLAPKHQQKLHLPYKKLHKQTIRRVCLPVNVIKTKIAKTRRHIKDSQSMDIDKIRKELIASKLLNPASKAPDALLRKIYADVKIIGSN
jgi:hypothetical protein